MTKKDKELLLKDLCARLSYGVKFETKYNKNTPYELLAINKYSGIVETDRAIWWDLEDIKPYLRPMSSMTDEERNEAIQFEINNLGPIGFNWDLLVSNSSKLVNWLNAHQFDYRGLIENGLALPAPEGMYNFK